MKKNKNILIFTGYYFPHLGGIESYIGNFTKELILLGYNPVLVTSNHQNLNEKEVINGLIIYRVPIYNIFKERYPIPKKNNKLKRILKELDEYEFDSIIVNTRFHLTSHIGAQYGKKHNIPVYLIEHGSNYVTLDNKFIDFFANRYEDFLTWKIKKKITRFYGVSNACNEWLKRININASGVWYNSVDTNQKILPKEKHKGINFLYAGRLIKQKGVENILKAFTKLAEEIDNIHLFIAGSGPEYDKYREKYNSKNITFMGKLTYEELTNYYAKTDVFLYPPLWPEGLPTSILEAGMYKCAVIGTNQGGIKEIIEHEKNGIIVDCDVNSLYLAMKNLCTNTDLIKKYANELNKTINDKFSWYKNTKKILGDINENRKK